MGQESFLFAVRSKYRELRPSEQKTADIILEKGREMTDWSIEKFAREAGVSQPTIIRFARAMGLKGYRELKNRVLEDYAKTGGSKEERILDYPVKREDKLVESEQGKTTQLYGYALHIEVVGYKDGIKKQGIPLSIAAQQLAKGNVKGTGILIPEEAFEPQQIFDELEKRGIYMHETWKKM